MLKLQLTIRNGRKIVYRSEISFTEEQKQKYFEKLLANGLDAMTEEVHRCVRRKIGSKKFDTELNGDHEKWGIYSDHLANYIQKNPDILIASGIQQTVRDWSGIHFHEFPNRAVEGMTEVVLLNKLEENTERVILKDGEDIDFDLYNGFNSLSCIVLEN